MDALQIHFVYGVALLAVVIVMSLWIMWLNLKNKSLAEHNKELYERILQRLDMVTNNSDYALIIRQNNQLRKQFEDLKEVFVEYVVRHLQNQSGKIWQTTVDTPRSKQKVTSPTAIPSEPQTVTPQATISRKARAFEAIVQDEPEESFIEELLIQEALHLIQKKTNTEQMLPIARLASTENTAAQTQERPAEKEAYQELSDMKAVEQLILKKLYVEALDAINQTLPQTEEPTEKAVLLIEKLIVQKALRLNSEKTEGEIDRLIRLKFSLQFDFSKLEQHVENEMEQVPYIERRLIQMKMQLLSMKR